MNYPHTGNKFHNSEGQLKRGFIKKRKLDNDEQPPPYKRQFLIDSSSPFKNNFSNDNEDSRRLQVREQQKKVLISERLKCRPAYSDNNLEQSNGPLQNPSANSRSKINYRNDEQAIERPRKTFDERLRCDSDGSKGYWGQISQEPKEPLKKNLANNRMKRFRATLQNKTSNKNEQATLVNTPYSTKYSNYENEDEFSEKSPTSNFKCHNSQTSYTWKKNNSNSSDNLSNFTNLNTSSSSSESSIRNRNTSAARSNIQERLHKVKSPPNNSKSFYENNKQRSINTCDTIGGGWFKPIDVEGKNESYNLHNRNYQESVSNTTNSTNNGLSQSDDGVASVYNASTSIHEDDAMDWSYIDEKEILSDLQDLRKSFNHTVSSTPRSEFQEIMAKESSEITVNTSLFKITYIVVDTNIFLSHLNTVKTIMNIKINGNTGVAALKVLVPWIVIQELDYIKDRRSYNKSNLNTQAQKAIRFINDCLTKNLNLKGQSVRDAAQQEFVTSNFDDGILHCCMQIRDRNNRAILLSNDVNLRNKLMTENLEAYSQREIIEKLDPFSTSIPGSSSGINMEETGKFSKIEIRLSSILTHFQIGVLKEVYKDVWNKMALLQQPPPWTLQTCLNIFKKYWIAVFGLNLPQRFLSNVKALDNFIHGGNMDLKRLLELALTICIILRSGYQDYSKNITFGMKSIQSIYDE